MKHIFIQPKYRDKQAAKAYKFLDWHCRKNKKYLMDEAKRRIEEWIIYGKVIHK